MYAGFIYLSTSVNLFTTYSKVYELTCSEERFKINVLGGFLWLFGKYI